MNTFESIGARLLDRGYLIIPIAKGQKRPAIDGWQNARITPAQLHLYNGSGVGILTGQGATPLCAIDIDTSFPDLADAMVAWLATRFGMTVTRVGNAPKVLAVYRQARPFRKAVSPWFEDYLGARHRLEVLGQGQQFVAYARHPETGQPYVWTDLFGGLLEVSPEDLPVLAAHDVGEILAVWAEKAALAGLQCLGSPSPPPAPIRDDDDGGASSATSAGEEAPSPLENYSPPLGLSIDQVRELVDLQDARDYDTWMRVGMALHHESGGASWGFDLWDDWSRGAPNYQGPDDLEKRWQGFGRTAGAGLTAGARRGVTMRSLIKAAADLGPAPTPGDAATRKRASYAWTEFGNADRLVDQYGQGLMFVPELARWYVWTGVYWRQAADAEMRQYARLTVEAMREEGEGLPLTSLEALRKWAQRSQTSAMCGSMLKLAEASPLVLRGADALDRHWYWLGTQNGMVDLRTGDLHAPNPDARLTRVARVVFDSSASAPLWERTLYEVFGGDVELVQFFQRLIGYALLGQPVEDILVLLWGLGSNGKSTVLSVLRYVLGTYAAMMPASTIVQDAPGAGNAGGARPDLLRLAGVRFAAMTEPDEGSVLREGFVKSVTGGEPVVARALYSSTLVEIPPSWVCFMATNHRPTIKGDDWGIWRRVVLVPFEQNFDSGARLPDGTLLTKDPDREARLIEEAVGVLAWCVHGALAYQRDGLKVPPKLEAARREYRSEMDLLASWIDERCRVKPAEAVDVYRGERGELLITLWQDWQNWATLRGEIKLVPSAKLLARRLRARGFVAEHSRKGLEFFNIALRTEKIADEN